MPKKRSATRQANRRRTERIWKLRLYIAGHTPKSVEAITNLRKICSEHLRHAYRIEVIDLLKTPQRARGDQIVAVPTLVRKRPAPVKKIVGDLSNTEHVLVGLNIRRRRRDPE